MFLSRDSVESESPYQYVQGNTVNWTDPSGFYPCIGAYDCELLPPTNPTEPPTPVPTQTPTLFPPTPTPTPEPRPECPTPTMTPTSIPLPPTGWKWQQLPLDNPGKEFYISYYNTTIESLHPIAQGELGETLQGVGLQRKVSSRLIADIRLQGSGYLDVVNGSDYNGFVSYNTETGDFRRNSCAETLTGDCARRLETGATSPQVSDRQATGISIGRNSENPEGGRGTKVYIESLNRQVLINDTGGSVTKYGIDVYVGLANEPVPFTNHTSKVWKLIKE